jgi:hypothetical protein
MAPSADSGASRWYLERVGRLTKRLLLVVLVVCAGFAASPQRSAAAGNDCGIPQRGTLWIDFADGSVPFWQLFARPGTIAAASNFIYPELLRSYGAKTVYWDMHLVRRVGTPLEPFDTSYVIDRANRMYDTAAMSMGCAHPIIAENELNASSSITPWSPTNAQYRRNVLIYLQTLAARGARPALLVGAPYTGDVAGDWWREVSQYADIVREAYFAAPRIAKLGPFIGGRTVRTLFRTEIAAFTAAGIPTRKLGIMLGFHTTPGSGGREHAKRLAWLDVTKLQALAAKEVAKELGLRSVWSWGWAVWGKNSPENDPDKPAAACVYLWARNPHLCNGPRAAGKHFDKSRDEGQIVLPAGARCTVQGKSLDWSAIRGLAPVTGDLDVAFTAVYSRIVASLFKPLKAKQLADAEKAVIAAHFGSVGAYRRALGRAHATPAVARGVIGDELRRELIEQRMTVSPPTGTDVNEYYTTYVDTPARMVESKSPAPWLGGRKKGLALASNAPPQIFRLKGSGWATVRTTTGVFQVRAVDQAVPLGGVPLSVARPAVIQALKAQARDQAYERWLVAKERAYDYATLCYRDRQPSAGLVPLTDYLPFLAAD